MTLLTRQQCQRVVEIFFDQVPDSAPLLNVYSKGVKGGSLRCARESLTAFFCETFGGEPGYSAIRYELSLKDAHSRFRIGPAEQEAWMSTMDEALRQAAVPATARVDLMSFFGQASAYMFGSVGVPSGQPVACGRQWAEFREVEDEVVRLKAGDSSRAVATARRIDGNAVTLAHLVGVMGTCGNHEAVEFAVSELLHRPELASASFGRGQTLVHFASARGGTALLKHLLETGSGAAMLDSAGHSPLYFAGNGFYCTGGADIVRMLVRHGGLVNAREGVQLCTPLHMAARRGNDIVAEALLACGADPEIRDKRGDRPLERALNCRKPAVAEILRRASR